MVAVEAFDVPNGGVKACLPADFNGVPRTGMAVPSANSINWGRLLPQLVYTSGLHRSVGQE